jgi:hypothetical protein
MEVGANKLLYLPGRPRQRGPSDFAAVNKHQDDQVRVPSTYQVSTAAENSLGGCLFNRRAKCLLYQDERVRNTVMY